MRTWSRTSSRTFDRTFDRAESGLPPVVPDPYFDYTTLLLPGNGTNGAQNNTFLDSSTNNFTITRNGNTTQGTFSPFSQTGWGNYFDGATATRLTMPSNTAFAFGTGAYTVEAWVYLSAHAATQTTVVDCGSATGSLNFSVLSTGALSLGVFGVGATLSSAGGAVTLNAWNHVAVVRESTASNATKLYVNGTAVATGTDTGNYTVTTTPAIGGLNSSGFTATGYISNVRLVKGTAVYTSNFTPSTTPLTAITNTSLLTCQSNRFIDNSANNFTITRNGDVSIQAFSPFNPTAAWSAATNGGSGYFDGSGDFITAPSNAAFALSGDFSMECWAYFAGATAVGGGPSGELLYAANVTGGAVICVRSGTTFALSAVSVADDLTASVTFTPGQWYHLVAARTGTTAVLYVNGTRVATGTVSRSYAQGGFSTQSGFNGYLASVRIVKGSNPYGTGTTITVPTAPLTAITNTSLLTNFTNAGIYDATSKNDLETVGNAQISTTQSKFGGSSMYFDGSGDGLLTPASAKTGTLQFGTGAYTVEFWLYLNSASGNQGLVTSAGGSGTGPIIAVRNGTLGSGIFGSADTVTASSTISSGQWYHIAFVRVSTATNQSFIYINGTLSGTGTISTNFSTDYGFAVGYTPSAGEHLNGYINDIRVTKGIARYTSNFTPPSTAFPLL